MAASNPTRRRAETRQRLVDVAYDVFAEVGIRDAPVELICERAGFTRGAFYSNFASKEALFLAVYEVQMAWRLDRLRTAIDAAVQAVDPAAPDASDRLVSGAGLAFMESLASDKTWHLLIVEFRAQALRQPELHQPTAAAEERFRTELAEIMQQTLDRVGLRLAVEPLAAVLTITRLYEVMLEHEILDDTAHGDYLTEVLPRLFGALLVPSNPEDAR